MIVRNLSIAIAVLASAGAPRAQEAPPPARTPSFADANKDIQRRAKESVAELNALREKITAEKIPLNKELRELEVELGKLKADSLAASRDLAARAVDLTNLDLENKKLRDQGTYLSALFSDYAVELESRLHVTELERYAEALETAKAAPDNANLLPRDVYVAQAALLGTSIDRLEDALGGTRFEAEAVDANSAVKKGTVVLIGPCAIFVSADGKSVGAADTELGSLAPSIFAFTRPEDAAAAEKTARDGVGFMPLDPTQGDAHKLAEANNETFFEHVKKGGPVMIPIFVMAGLALLIALYKWLALSLVRKPSRRQMARLLEAVRAGDKGEAQRVAHAMRGPGGKMLAAGADHIDEPRDLIEEVMYETVLTTRLKLQRMLPFIAICAASAPLLGLLGTVTGIINTFKMIEVFGSSDVQSLSGGISEALITTKFGLIVAIPSLLLHAFLARKTRGVLGRMETGAVTFVNEVCNAPTRRGERGAGGDALGGSHAPDPGLVRAHVSAILGDMLGPLARETADGDLLQPSHSV